MSATMPNVWPSVVHMLADAAARAPQHVAAICGDESLTYAEFAACVSGLALELQGSGVGKDARVALVMNNSLDIAIATFGVQAAGAQVVLVELASGERPSDFRVALRNFYVITRYNRSAFYAAAVADLARELRKNYDLGR